MKAPPRRKGNTCEEYEDLAFFSSLNESPSKKEGKYWKENQKHNQHGASMKAPPRRKGNLATPEFTRYCWGLNESPSKKEGKWIVL